MFAAILLALAADWCNLIFETTYNGNAQIAAPASCVYDGSDPSGMVTRVVKEVCEGSVMAAYSAWWERAMYNHDHTVAVTNALNRELWQHFAETNAAFESGYYADAGGEWEFGDWDCEQSAHWYGIDLAPDGWRVNRISPGTVFTTNETLYADAWVAPDGLEEHATNLVFVSTRPLPSFPERWRFRRRIERTPRGTPVADFFAPHREPPYPVGASSLASLMAFDGDGMTASRRVPQVLRVMDYGWLKALFADCRALSDQPGLSSSWIERSDAWGELGVQDLPTSGFVNYPHRAAREWLAWECALPAASATEGGEPLAPSVYSHAAFDEVVARSLYADDFWFDYDEASPHEPAPIPVSLWTDCYCTFVTNRCWGYITNTTARLDYWQHSAWNNAIRMYDRTYTAQNALGDVFEHEAVSVNVSTGVVFAIELGADYSEDPREHHDYWTNELMRITDERGFRELVTIDLPRGIPESFFGGTNGVRYAATNAWRSPFPRFAARVSGDECAAVATYDCGKRWGLSYEAISNAHDRIGLASTNLITCYAYTAAPTRFWYFPAAEYRADLADALTNLADRVSFDFSVGLLGRMARTLAPTNTDAFAAAIRRPSRSMFARGRVGGVTSGALQSMCGRADIPALSDWGWNGESEGEELDTPGEFYAQRCELTHRWLRATREPVARTDFAAVAEGFRETAASMLGAMRTRAGVPPDFWDDPQSWLAANRTAFISLMWDVLRERLGNRREPAEFAVELPSGTRFAIRPFRDPGGVLCYEVDGAFIVAPGGVAPCVRLNLARVPLTDAFRAAIDEYKDEDENAWWENARPFWCGGVLDYWSRVDWLFYNYR